MTVKVNKCIDRPKDRNIKSEKEIMEKRITNISVDKRTVDEKGKQDGIRYINQ